MNAPIPPGFRMPAEWEPQAAIWFSWPVASGIWPGHRSELWESFASLVALCSHYQPVSINAQGGAHGAIRDFLNRARCDLSLTTLFDHPTDDVWCRDHGPIWLKHDASGEVAITDWRFNGWGEKFHPHDRDDRVPARMAEALGLQHFEQADILEGGAIETDGAGRLLTTETVLLNRNRGSGLSKSFWHTRFREALAIDAVTWLPGGLPNDDTDGHIDNVARFTESGTVLMVDPEGDELLQQGMELLKKDRGVQILPRPQIYNGRVRLPASYANYVLLNGLVLVPAYGERKRDETALGLILDCFRGRKGRSLDCRLFIAEGGALHCLTTNQPG